MSTEFFLDGLERDLVAAAARRSGEAKATPAPAPVRRRPPLRAVALAAALVTAGVASATGGTLLALRGTGITSAPATPPEQVAAAGTARVEAFRIADPDRGRLPWTVRVARSRKGGLVCSTVGQVDARGRFGLVGTDGRFRVLDAGVSDSCGAPQGNAITLIGARIFDAPRAADVRTVVSGVGGPQLRSARLSTTDPAGPARALPLDHGAFAAVLRGYPEDHGIRVTLTFADGHRETRTFGTAPGLVQTQGVAWRLMTPTMVGAARLAGASCAWFLPVRTTAASPISPAVCGRLTGPCGCYFAARRLSHATVGRGAAGEVPRGRWPAGAAPVTAVWGRTDGAVRSVSYTLPGGRETPLRLLSGGGLLIVAPASTDPDRILVHLRLADGRTVTAHGDTGLIDTTP